MEKKILILAMVMSAMLTLTVVEGDYDLFTNDTEVLARTECLGNPELNKGKCLPDIDGLSACCVESDRFLIKDCYKTVEV